VRHRKGGRRYPLSQSKFQIGLLTVILLVVLRLSLGCHFLYEGVWKIEHSDEFSAEPFLSLSKGPVSPLFHALLDDIDGRTRLAYEAIPPKDAVDKPKIVYEVSSERTVAAWTSLTNGVAGRYGFSDQQRQKADGLLKFYASALQEYLNEHADEIAAHFQSLDRFEAERGKSPSPQAAELIQAKPSALDYDRQRGHNDAPYYKKRVWDRQQELRREVKVWLTAMDKMGESLASDLRDLVTEEQRAGFSAKGWNPLTWTRNEQLNFAVTYGLTAIGACLMLGFCTRLAALGGAAFMCSVVLTQFPWPTIYPPAPAEAGHALLVNKDFIEMVALLLLSTTAAGRWGGLDGPLYTICRAVRQGLCPKNHCVGRKA
jgi:uncharacterized membrane protein YphA (DoxX/SURF4 family)